MVGVLVPPWHNVWFFNPALGTIVPIFNTPMTLVSVSSSPNRDLRDSVMKV